MSLLKASRIITTAMHEEQINCGANYVDEVYLSNPTDHDDRACVVGEGDS